MIPAEPIAVSNHPVLFAERIRDHNAILEAFFKSHASLHHSPRTVEFDRRFLQGWFSGHRVKDNEHPNGRQLFVWEAMDPSIGPEIIQAYSAALAETDLYDRTCRDYMGRLKFFFNFVLNRPVIPTGAKGCSVSITSKYNPITNPVSKYLYPAVRGIRSLLDYPLVEEYLNEFLCWLLEQHLPESRIPLVTSRTYAQIVSIVECGFRYFELEQMDCQGTTPDIFPERGKIRTRFGKATDGSGPRTREVDLTPFARDTIKYYEDKIRCHFPNAEAHPALFLTRRGGRVG